MERNPSPDVVSFHPDRLSAERWRALRDEFSGREEARDALLDVALACERRDGSATKYNLPSVKIELEAREFRKLQKLLRVAHLVDRSKPAVTIKRGRGGRVQRRMVAELPKGLDTPARVRIAQKFAAYLAEKRMMYTVVVHAPDAYNHVDNHHMHAVAYDRPCEFLEEHGCWDFEYAVKDKWGRTRYPRRQHKMADLTRPKDGKRYREHGASVIIEMRRVWEECCNEELRKIGVNRLFDHRSYKTMCIDQAPGRHLGSGAAALEAVGVPTFVGIENAEKSYTGALSRIHQAHANRKTVRADCREEANGVVRRAAPYQAMLPQVLTLGKLLGELDALEVEIGDQERDLALYGLWLKMANSRAEDTIRRCKPIVDAIEDGTAKPADVRCEEALRDRVRAAEQHLAAIRAEIGEDVEKVAMVSADVATKVSSIDLLLTQIQTITDELTEKLATVPQQEQAHAREDMAARDTHAPRQDRRSRQLQEYFEAPLDYEEEWDRVFHRIQLEGLEVLPPSGSGPVYRVPSIAKKDLDRLTHPIFRKRSQARLKAMYRIQEWKRERAARAFEASIIATDAEFGPSAETEGRDRARDLEYAALAEEARQKAANERAEAVESWFADLDRAGCGLPVKFRDRSVELDIGAVPDHMRTFADLMDEQILPVMKQRVERVRQDVRAALEANPMAVQPTTRGFAYYLERFPEELRANVVLFLRDDPTTRDHASRVAHSHAQLGNGARQPAPAAARPSSRAQEARRPEKTVESPAQTPSRPAAEPSTDLTDEQIEYWKWKNGMTR
jgi:hypothetical protein